MSQPILEIIERKTELIIGTSESPTVLENYAKPRPEILIIDTGPRGDSAYEIAVQEGFNGSKAEWLASLQSTTTYGEAEGGFVQIPFEFNNVSPRVVYTLPSAMIVISATLSVKTAFDGIGASLKVGTVQNPELLIAEADNAPSFVTSFGVEMYEELAGGTEIIITTFPGAGASAGAGNLILETVRT